MTHRELLEARAREHGIMEDLHKRIQGESRDFTADERSQWDKANAEFDRLTSLIRTEERMSTVSTTLQGEGTVNLTNPDQGTDQGQQPAGNERRGYEDLFSEYIRRGFAEMTIDERRAIRRGYVQHEKRGTDTQVGDVTGLGGYTVPTQFSNELERAMIEVSGMLEASRIFTTASGGTLEWPTVDDTATNIAWYAQGATITVQDFATAQILFSDYTAATQVKMSFQLLNDEGVNLQGELAQMLGERMGRGVNAALTNGTGTGQPTGVLNGITTGENAAAAAITRENIVNLMHSVDRAYRGPAAFMFNDSTLAAIKKLSFGSADDRPLWQPSVREGEPDRLEGKPYVINNDFPDIGTGNDSMAFGNWSKYIVRRVGSDQLIRTNDRYADELSVGFILYGRYDGKLIQPNAIKALTHA